MNRPMLLGRGKSQFAVRVVVLAIGAFITANALAEDARVLPAGRSRFSFAYGRSGAVDQTFNEYGKPEFVTAPYNLPLDSSMMKKLGQKTQLGDLINLLNADSSLRYDVSKRTGSNHGIVLSDDNSLPLLGDALSAGFLGVEAHAVRQQFALSLMHGITDRLSAGLMVPILKDEVTVNPSLAGLNTAQDIYYGYSTQRGSALGQQLSDGLNFLRSANMDTLQSLLVSAGYDPFSTYSGSGIGDIVLGSRYNYFNRKLESGEWISSAQLGVTVPTGRVSLPREITVLDRGSGVWDVGVANILNYSFWSPLTLSHGIHYTWRVPGTKLKRVRTSPGDIAPDPSTEENVSARLGDKYWTSLGATLKFNDTISLDSSYEWFWKRQDKYSGTTSKDYGYLSGGTDQYLETLEVGLTFSSLAAFMKHDFPLPGALSVAYYLPMKGRNYYIAPYGIVELDMYF